jgi:hypothetical protein
MHTLCNGTTRAGNPCGNRPITGGTVCRMHGGSAPAVKAKAAERKQQEAVRRTLMALGEPEPIDPAQALLNLIAWKHGEVQWLRSKVQAVQDEVLVWGATEHREGVGPEGPISVTSERAQPNVWWSLLRQAEDQLSDYASKALRAGVAERQIRLAESTGAAIAGVVNVILDRLQLNAVQRGLVPTVVPEAFRMLKGTLL